MRESCWQVTRGARRGQETRATQGPSDPGLESPFSSTQKTAPEYVEMLFARAQKYDPPLLAARLIF